MHLTNFPSTARLSSLVFVWLLSILAGIPLGCGSAFATDLEEKRALDHEDYDRWNSIGGRRLSDDGKWVSFVIQPAKGDGTLTIRRIDSAKEYSVLRGGSATFTPDSKYAIYSVSPDPEVIKRLKKEKLEAEAPQTRLEILNLESGEQTIIEGASRFTTPDKVSPWVAFKMLKSREKPSVVATKTELTETWEITPEGIQRPEKEKVFRELPEKEKKETGEASEAANKSASKSKQEISQAAAGEKAGSAKKSPGKKKDKPTGETLVLHHIETGFEQRFPYVQNFAFNEDGSLLVFTTSTPSDEKAAKDNSGIQSDGVHVLDLGKLQLKQILTGLGNYGRPVFSKDGRSLAFATDRDDYAAEEPQWSLYGWSVGKAEAKLWVDSKTKGMPSGWEVASSAVPFFSDDGRRLYLRTRPVPEPQGKDGENNNGEGDDKEPVAKLDLWHWQDPFLQPQQLIRAAQVRNRSYQALLHVNSGKFVQLATEEIPTVSVDRKSSSPVVLGEAQDEYNKMQSWDTQSFSDWFLIDVTTGKARKVAEMKRGNPRLSPQGKFVFWWDGELRTWFCMSADQAMEADAEEFPESVDVGKSIEQPLFNELHDQPSLPGSYGSAGWLADDSGLLIYDRWDLWLVDPMGQKQPECITLGTGREREIIFRYVEIDPEAVAVDPSQPMIFSAFVHATKASGYYRRSIPEPVSSAAVTETASTAQTEEGTSSGAEQTVSLKPLIMLDENIGSLVKAKDSDVVIFTRSTFERFPDLWASTLEFKSLRRLTRANPQQDEYLWGTAELVHWNAKDGQELDGLLYKPEGFDASKKYPLMVYFYERNSDTLHNYHTPAAGRSTINFSFYVSRGYVIFIPDISYEVGEPGPSAANAILPGVESLVAQGFVDPERIGMQGHSWGGYQTAYLVTVTDMFACAESGAPVSNMTSAYGGIRWGSGMSRMFQYEKTQSRIGATLWEARDRYIANSPVFFADKVNTPLLILHNDEDTAVPWYQGIELFVALRRLEKPVWMLNYNGDPHWVMSEANRIDFAKRMQQFFDHYLKGEPMPVWMAEGIPAVDKGKQFGFEYIPPEETSVESER